MSYGYPTTVNRAQHTISAAHPISPRCSVRPCQVDGEPLQDLCRCRLASNAASSTSTSRKQDFPLFKCNLKLHALYLDDGPHQLTAVCAHHIPTPTEPRLSSSRVSTLGPDDPEEPTARRPLPWACTPSSNLTFWHRVWDLRVLFEPEFGEQESKKVKPDRQRSSRNIGVCLRETKPPPPSPFAPRTSPPLPTLTKPTPDERGIWGLDKEGKTHEVGDPLGTDTRRAPRGCAKVAPAETRTRKPAQPPATAAAATSTWTAATALAPLPAPTHAIVLPPVAPPTPLPALSASAVWIPEHGGEHTCDVAAVSIATATTVTTRWRGAGVSVGRPRWTDDTGENYDDGTGRTRRRRRTWTAAAITMATTVRVVNTAGRDERTHGGQACARARPCERRAQRAWARRAHARRTSVGMRVERIREPMSTLGANAGTGLVGVASARAGRRLAR
ncbi:hypothetical protein BJ912DRAFT_931802 [Pholiota molesta]|nr:hypothetical protein BJ912DRAFT_931802 [Pholiota molesta]